MWGLFLENNNMKSCIKNSFNINFTKNLLNNQNYVLWKHIKEKIMKVEEYQNVWKGEYYIDYSDILIWNKVSKYLYIASLLFLLSISIKIINMLNFSNIWSFALLLCILFITIMTFLYIYYSYKIKVKYYSFYMLKKWVYFKRK